MTDTIQLEQHGPVATLSLNRAPRNTMTPALMKTFHQRIQQVADTPSIRALIVTSREGHFCAGAELSDTLPGEIQALGGPPGTAVRLRQVYQPFLALTELPIPTVAAVRGAAVGGGFGLAMVCDFRVVTPETRFLAPFAKLGICPGLALTHLLPTLVGLPRAMEILMLGESIRGQRALDWGLAHRCVSEDCLMTEAETLAARLAAGAPAVMRFTKMALHRGAALNVSGAADFEALAQALTFASKDADEGRLAFFEKRAPDFKGE